MSIQKKSLKASTKSVKVPRQAAGKAPAKAAAAAAKSVSLKAVQFPPDPC